MRADPQNVRIIKPVEARLGNAMTDAEGFIVLSDRDIERIATKVVDLLSPNAKQAPLQADDPYIPVHRNAPRREMSEY